MNNKIVNITKNEAQSIKADAVKNREIYFAEIELSDKGHWKE